MRKLWTWLPSSSVLESALCWAASERLAGATGSRVDFGLEVFVGEQERTPGLQHVPLDVVGEQAQENVGANAALQVVVDGTHFKIQGLERTKGPFHLAQ